MKQILKDRLLIERLKADKQNSILDIIEGENAPFMGVVLKIGKSVEDIKEKDIVLFKESDSLSVYLDGKNLFILREYDIIGIL